MAGKSGGLGQRAPAFYTPRVAEVNDGQRWKRSSTDNMYSELGKWICVLEKWMDDG